MRTAATPLADEADLRDVELRAWRGLVRAHAALVKRLDAELETGHGLSLSSYQVLSALADAPSGKMRMCELAESVALSRSGLTRLVDRLEREGLIARACCHVDARGAYAVLTASGRERLEQARPTHLAAVRQDFVAHFSDAELERLAQMWRRVAPESAED
jgi:DNA-binding MarR family transcriptional regulator